MCLGPKNSYLSRRTYSDTSTSELLEARGDRQVLSMFKTFTTTPEQSVNVSEPKEPSTKHKSKLRVIPIKMGVKHDVT